MSILLRNLSPLALQEEIKRLLMNQGVGQVVPPYTGYPGGAAYPPAFVGGMPSYQSAASPFISRAMPTGFFPRGFGGHPHGSPYVDRRLPYPEIEEEGETDDTAAVIPALFDPEEDEPASYEMCVDRCHQANRRDIRDCYKKRGRMAKAICIGAAMSRLGSCIAACQKYKKK
jgi:hypothetical protein